MEHPVATALSSPIVLTLLHRGNSEEEAAPHCGADRLEPGAFGAVVIDALADFPMSRILRASSAADAVAQSREHETLFLVGELQSPEEAVQFIVALKVLREKLANGSLRAIACLGSGLPKAACESLESKLRLHGCSEVFNGSEPPQQIIRRCRVLLRYLAFQYAFRRLPDGHLTPAGLAVLMGAWVEFSSWNTAQVSELLCACLAAATGAGRVELWSRPDQTHSNWFCHGTSDGETPELESALITAFRTRRLSTDVGIEWIGQNSGAAFAYRRQGDALSADAPEKLYQAAAELVRGWVDRNPSTSAENRFGLKY